MNPTRTSVDPLMTIGLSPIYAHAIKKFCARWKAQRRREARARELETVLREMDPRLHRDLGFELMAGRRGDPTAPSSHALIQAVMIAGAAERREEE
jgi:hypothetical protein